MTAGNAKNCLDSDKNKHELDALTDMGAMDCWVRQSFCPTGKHTWSTINLLFSSGTARDSSALAGTKWHL